MVVRGSVACVWRGWNTSTSPSELDGVALQGRYQLAGRWQNAGLHAPTAQELGDTTR